MSVQRYEATGYDCEIVQAEYGEYVLYEDYEKLKKECDALRELHQLAYDALTPEESVHWTHQAINHLEDWTNDTSKRHPAGR